MILDGNSRVSDPKVYATQKEMDQEREIERLQKELAQAEEASSSMLIKKTGEEAKIRISY